MDTTAVIMLVAVPVAALVVGSGIAGIIYLAAGRRHRR